MYPGCPVRACPSPCVCQEDLANTAAKLNACEEELAGDRADTDGDGTPNDIDQCQKTPPSVATDLLGCSQEQFCGNFSGKDLRARLHCAAADWKNDEPVSARGCSMRHGTCIPRQFRRGCWPNRQAGCLSLRGLLPQHDEAISSLKD